MVSKPIADYAVVPDLHAAVFLVRADVKSTNLSFARGHRLFFISSEDAEGLKNPHPGKKCRKKAPPAAPGATSFV